MWLYGMGLKKILARIKCYFTSSCCKADVTVNVEPATRVKPTLSQSAFNKEDYKKYIEGLASDE